MKKVLKAILPCMLFACGSQFDTSLRILYVGEYSTSPITVNCQSFEGEYYETLKDSLITDIELKSEIIDNIGDLKRSEVDRILNYSDVNVKIKLLASYSDGSSDTVCLGAFSNIFLNGIMMAEDSVFRQKIKTIIY